MSTFAIKKSSMGRTARTAGLLYLIVVLTGIFSLVYVPSQITVAGDASATASNILASEQLFRLGIVVGLICYTALLLLPFALYKLLSSFGKNAALLMVAFAVVQVPIFFVSLISKFNALTLLSNAEYLQAFTTEQLHAQAMISLAAYNNGLLVSEIFMGLWLLPFGYLVFKSGFIPKLLGILLMAGCFGYLASFLESALSLDYSNVAMAKYIALPAAIGEIGTCLWLLIMGARMPAILSGTARGAA